MQSNIWNDILYDMRNDSQFFFVSVHETPVPHFRVFIPQAPSWAANPTILNRWLL